MSQVIELDGAPPEDGNQDGEEYLQNKRRRLDCLYGFRMVSKMLVETLSGR